MDHNSEIPTSLIFTITKISSKKSLSFGNQLFKIIYSRTLDFSLPTIQHLAKNRRYDLSLS